PHERALSSGLSRNKLVLSPMYSGYGGSSGAGGAFRRLDQFSSPYGSYESPSVQSSPYQHRRKLQMKHGGTRGHKRRAARAAAHSSHEGDGIGHANVVDVGAGAGAQSLLAPLRAGRQSTGGGGGSGAGSASEYAG
ncbi:unnamed protein product, partial [Phaeothamnion confervicola]